MAGHGGGDAARDGPRAHPRASLRPRVRAALGELGGVPARGAAGAAGDLRRLPSAPRRAVRAVHAGVRREGERRRRPRRSCEIARAIGDAGSALATHIWRNAAAGNLGGWQVARALELLVVLVGAVGTPGGTAPSAWNKAIPAPPMMPPPGKVWSELLMPQGVPAGLLRDELPAAALPARGARQARDVLHARLQPGVDQPRRDVVDRDADGRGQGRAPRLPHAGVERDGVVRRLRAADGPRLRAPRPHVAGDARRALDRLPPARAARRARAARPDASISPGRRTRRPGSARCGRRTSSGSSCRGGSIPTAALGIRKYFESPYRAGREAAHRGVLSLDVREQRAGAAGGRRSGRG